MITVLINNQYLKRVPVYRIYILKHHCGILSKNKIYRIWYNGVIFCFVFISFFFFCSFFWGGGVHGLRAANSSRSWACCDICNTNPQRLLLCMSNVTFGYRLCLVLFLNFNTSVCSWCYWGHVELNWRHVYCTAPHRRAFGSFRVVLFAVLTVRCC